MDRMPNVPAADIDIDDDLVLKLLEDQCPALAELPLAPLASGWDNQLFRLGDTLMVRLPRRQVAAPQMANELRHLPDVSAQLPVEVPVPSFTGQPSELFPWPWMVGHYIPGVPASTVPRGERIEFAEQLADVLWTLHMPAPGYATVNPYRGGPLSQERFRVNVPRRTAGHPQEAELLARWEAWSSAPAHDGPAVWLHGDAHPHNFIVGEDRRLRGVIDWGDMTPGDPACDLATAWLTFDAAGRERFIAQVQADSQLDEAVWARAKAWALHLALIMLRETDDQPRLTQIGTEALSELLAESV